jgi:glycine/D-amino acid oxidase-like deaminating enzyme
MKLQLNEKPYRTIGPAVTTAGAYCPVSFWHETISVRPGTPLAENIQCDVAIVGGGFTGLSNAIALKTVAPSLDVVLLEHSVVGHGASGRNGGFAMPLIGWDLTDAAHKLGEDGAGRAYRLMYDAVEHLRRTVRDRNIDCDMEETGYLLLATSKARLGRVRHEVELGKRLGFDLEYLDGAALREHVSSASFLAGAYDPHPFIVNPAKLARGLKTVAERLGVRVFEQTPVLTLDDGKSIALTTRGGRVAARAVVLAMNGYGGAMGIMASRILPVHTYIVMTEPLSQSDLESTGWHKRRTSLETARNFIHYFRLTVDNRILFGGEDADLFFGGIYRDHHEGMFAALERRFREYFPTLRHVPFTHRWGGALGVTLDMFPTFGAGGEHGTIFHAAGYSGHGVSLSNYAGTVLAPHVLHAIGEKAGTAERPFFFGRMPFPVPPEPLRYVALQAYRLALRAQDTWQGA